MVLITMADLAYVRKIYRLLGYQWSWGSNSPDFFRAVLMAPIEEEFIFRLCGVGIPYFFYGLTSVELWGMVGWSSLVFAVGHYDRGPALVILHYLPAGISYAAIFIAVSEITDVVHGYGAVVLLHTAYNFLVGVGPQRMRFLGR